MVSKVTSPMLVRSHSYHPHEVKFFPGGENAQKFKRLFFRGWPFFSYMKDSTIPKRLINLFSAWTHNNKPVSIQLTGISRLYWVYSSFVRIDFYLISPLIFVILEGYQQVENVL